VRSIAGFAGVGVDGVEVYAALLESGVDLARVQAGYW
jgi:hypothetical protein